MNKGKLLFFFLFVSIPSLAYLTYAQLGEQAGQPFFNVSIGGSSTFNYSIFNSGATPINYKVILPTLNTIPHNATPTVTATPMNGTLAPGSQQRISVTAYMPSSDKPGLVWHGILQVVEVSAPQRSTGGIGAVIVAGVAKIVTIESAQPKFNILEIIVPAIIVVAVAGGAGSYYYLRKRKLAAARRSRMDIIRKVKKKARAKHAR